ncbi:MAG TPA: ABC transporter ATP-binding protein [Acidimicrobiales bacterium]|nr:ABC transporter ATP-binding protein [Acidimicrobiales bacterium]
MGEERLVVDSVTVRFGGMTALDGVSLHVPPNETVGVIGPNGAGKTTLFNVICGFVSPSDGTLVLDGRPLRRHRPHDLAKLGIARTLQGVGLFPGLSVAENVMAGATTTARAGFVPNLFGLPRAGRDERRLRERAVAVMEEMRIGAWADRSPAELPYAIQKRVALARALVADPALLLLDEPASGLSEAEMAELGHLIRRLSERMSVLLVEHHMDLVMSVCDRLVVLDFGRVIATGPPDEVKADPRVTRAYLGEDASGIGHGDMELDASDEPEGRSA